MTTTARTPFDGKPYFCTTCGDPCEKPCHLAAPEDDPTRSEACNLESEFSAQQRAAVFNALDRSLRQARHEILKGLTALFGELNTESQVIRRALIRLSDTLVDETRDTIRSIESGEDDDKKGT